MFEYNGQKYDLKFNIGRIKLVEAAIGRSAAEAVLTHGGMMTISDIETFFSYGLKEAGSDVFMKPKEAAEIADGVIEGDSYAAAVLLVQEALKRDMGFLFRLTQ